MVSDLAFRKKLESQLAGDLIKRQITVLLQCRPRGMGLGDKLDQRRVTTHLAIIMLRRDGDPCRLADPDQLGRDRQALPL